MCVDGLGVIFYSNMEGWNIDDSAYFITVTVTTVGKTTATYIVCRPVYSDPRISTHLSQSISVMLKPSKSISWVFMVCG